MTDFVTRASRILAAATLLGATAFSTAQATDWGQLKASSWSEQAGQAGTATDDDAEGMSSSTNAGGAAIASAFEGLGMDPARAECYGAVLSDKLSPSEQDEAAALVRTASNADDVRSAVMNAGPTIVGGFSAANTTCPEHMGG